MAEGYTMDTTMSVSPTREDTMPGMPFPRVLLLRIHCRRVPRYRKQFECVAESPTMDITMPESSMRENIMLGGTLLRVTIESTLPESSAMETIILELYMLHTIIPLSHAMTRAPRQTDHAKVSHDGEDHVTGTSQT